MPFKANNNREAVVVCARHVVKRPSKRSVLVNNKEAWDYLQSKESERASALSFVLDFQLNEGELSNIRYKFSNLKSTREYARKKTDLPMWEDLLFYSFLPTSMGVNPGGDGGDASPPLFGVGGTPILIVPPTFCQGWIQV